MQTPDALKALAALSHGTRLEVFRLLMREGAIGLPAGQIAERLEVGPSTLSPHLAQLERAGLVTSSRDERRIIYAVNIEGMRALLTYLTEECCGGHPQICGFAPGRAEHEDDLRPSELRHIGPCAGDDRECGRAPTDRRVSKDTAKS